MNTATRIDAIDVSGHPEPVMPGACQSGGCGCTTPDPRIRPAPPSFGRVSVNGTEIAPEAIAREIQHHPAANGETAWQEAARALALRELLLQQARRLGLASQPAEDESGRLETDDDALVRTLLEQALQPAQVTDTECQRYYEGHIQRFRTPTLFEASHILFEPDAPHDTAWNAARAQAYAVMQTIGDDPQQFADAAREFSRCPTAQQGGSLGQIRRGELVDDLQRVLDVIPEHSVWHEPIRSRFGWHVLRLQRRIEGRTLPFDMVKTNIAAMLEARALTTQAARYVADLAQSATIEGILLDPSRVAHGAAM